MTGYWKLNGDVLNTATVNIYPINASLDQQVRQARHKLYGGAESRERLGKDLGLKRITIRFSSSLSSDKWAEVARAMDILEDDDVWTLEAPASANVYAYKDNKRAAFSTVSINQEDPSGEGPVTLTIRALVEGVWTADGGTYYEPISGGRIAYNGGFISESGLVAASERAINLLDYSGNSHTLTETGTLTSRGAMPGFGKYGNGVTGITTSDYLSSTDAAFDINGDLTLFVAFEYALTSEAVQYLLVDGATGGSNWDSYALYIDSGAGNHVITYAHQSSEAGGNYSLVCSVNLGDLGSSEADGTAHTFALRRDSSTGDVTAYLDGVESASGTYSTVNQNPTGDSDNDLFLGVDGTEASPATPLHGSLFEARIEGSLLDEESLKRLADANARAFERQAIGGEEALWPLDGTLPVVVLPEQTPGYPKARRVSDGTMVEMGAALSSFNVETDGGNTVTYEEYDLTGFLSPSAPSTDGDGATFEARSSPSADFLDGTT